jgi:hypothetical protein
MSLTSYRAAPPRVGGCVGWYVLRSICCVCWKTWRRPTLPRLETQYHRRWGFSRPSSGWDRVQSPRQSHQVVQHTHRMPPVLGGAVRFWRVGVYAVWLVLSLFASGHATALMWMTAVQDGTLAIAGGVLGNRADRAIRTS